MKKHPETLTFFLDESINCDSLANALEREGVLFERALDHFPEGTPDPVWIVEVSKRGWVILTHDFRTRKVPYEFAAVGLSAARVFAIRGHGLSGEEKAARVVRQLKRIQNIARSEPAPFYAKILKDKVDTAYRGRELRVKVEEVLASMPDFPKQYGLEDVGQRVPRAPKGRRRQRGFA